MEYRTKILKEIRIGISKENNQITLLAGIIVLGMILLTLIFMLPTIKRIVTLKTETQELERAKADYTKILSTYEKATKYNKEIKPYKERIYARVPTNPQSIEAFNELDMISRTNNLNLTKITTKRLLSNQEDFEIIFSGNFPDIEKFFEKISTSRRYFNVTNLKIRQISSDKPRDSNLLMNITISSLFLSND